MTARGSGPALRSLLLPVGLMCLCGLALLYWTRGGGGPARQAPPAPGGGGAPVFAPPAPQARPNVLWLLLDACRADRLSAYGYERRTSPAMEALAARGALFERNYAQGSNTLLSVGSYLTGRHFPAFYQDARHLEVSFLKLPAPDEKLLSSVLGEAGYRTAMFSASPWYSEDSRLARSFHEFSRLEYGPGPPTRSYAERNPALFGWLERHAERPFFLYVHMLDTHEPRYANNTDPRWLEPGFPEARDRELRWWPDGPYSDADKRHLSNLYDGGVSYADSVVGELLQKLDQLGLTERTLVVVSSDHGELLVEDGVTLGHPGELSYDELLHTPLILAGPGVPSGRRVQVRTENADIVPTLVELLGLRVEAGFDGLSLVPVLAKPRPAEPHPYVLARSMAFLTHTRPTVLLLYDDVKFDFGALEPQELRDHGLPVRPREQVWAMPDRAGTRRAADVSPAQLEAARALMAGPIEAAWQTHATQPVEIPPYFGIMQGGTVTPDAESDALDFRDGRWTRKRARTALRLGESALLIADPVTEQAPTMVMGVAVPNGTYEVSLYSTTGPTQGTARGVSFRFMKYPEEGEFRLFRLPPADSPAEPRTAWLPLGTYTVSDGHFRYMLKPGDAPELSVVGSFRFTRTGATGALPSEQELREELQRLKATGYVQ